MSAVRRVVDAMLAFAPALTMGELIEPFRMGFGPVLPGSMPPAHMEMMKRVTTETDLPDMLRKITGALQRDIRTSLAPRPARPTNPCAQVRPSFADAFHAHARSARTGCS